MKTLVFANQKGGEGKTTLAVHMAFYAQDRGCRVLFVDLDTVGSASRTLKQYASHLAATQLFDAERVDLPASGTGITLLAGNGRLVVVDRAPEFVVYHLMHHLRTLSRQFDLCVIDTATAPGLREDAALAASDFVVIPTQLASFSSVANTIGRIDQVRAHFHSQIPLLGVLANRVNGRWPTHHQALIDLQRGANALPMAVMARQSIPDALAENRPVWTLATTSAREAGREMKTALQVIVQRMGGLPQAPLTEAPPRP